MRKRAGYNRESMMSDRDSDMRNATGIGDFNEMFSGAYEELRRVAHRRLGAEAGGHTLNTTGLVNETYLKLSTQRNDQVGNRAQFFALAAMAMRRILVDYARKHHAQKRSGQLIRVSIEAFDNTQLEMAEPSAVTLVERADLLVALDEALNLLMEVDERAAKVVDCRFFLGLTEPETADILGVTQRTIGRDWVRARAWLKTHLKSHSDHEI